MPGRRRDESQGSPEDWPVEEPPADTSSPDEGIDPDEPTEKEYRDTGDRGKHRDDADDPEPSGREGLAGRS